MGTPDRALAWLEPRLEEVPAELADAVRACVRRVGEDAGSDGVAGLLAEAAVAEFDRVLELPQSRENAVRLLAADASLTYAFEATADLGEDPVALSDAAGIRGRIGERLERLAAGAGQEPPLAGEAGTGPPGDGPAGGTPSR